MAVTAHTGGPWTVGDEIRKARMDAGFDQEQLAKLVGVSRPTISKWERDKSQPTIGEFRKIARETGASWLLSVQTSSEMERPRFTLINGETTEERRHLRLGHWPPDGIPERRRFPVAAVANGV